jgi:hypothetical protein
VWRCEQRGTNITVRDVKPANDPFCTVANPTLPTVLRDWTVPPARATQRVSVSIRKQKSTACHSTGEVVDTLSGTIDATTSWLTSV